MKFIWRLCFEMRAERGVVDLGLSLIPICLCGSALLTQQLIVNAMMFQKIFGLYSVNVIKTDVLIFIGGMNVWCGYICVVNVVSML